MSSVFRFIYTFLNKKWHFDQIANELIAVKAMNFGYSLSFRTLDKGIIEQFGPSGFASTIFNNSFNFLGSQTGFIFHSIFLFIASFCLYFFIYLLHIFGIVFPFFNMHFVLLFFGYLLLILSKLD
jgi:hypothetical protein